MKIMMAGSWHWPMYELAFCQALAQHGHEIVPFSFSPYFAGLLGRYQSTVPAPGPALWKINGQLLEAARVERPDVLCVWRGTHILPGTIERLNRAGILTVSYNNDDPFGPSTHGNVPWHHHFLWRWYLRSLPLYQHNFFYRDVNVRDAERRGVAVAHVLMPYFVPAQHRPVLLNEAEKIRFGCDVVFVGHYEPDGRVDCLRELVRAGLSVKLFGGPYWTREALGDLYSYFAPITTAVGDDYAKALCGAKLCVAFLSKMNRDTYTRRCFEIPACGRLLLCERTDDMKRMFIEGEEVVLFSSKAELTDKARRLLSRPDEIARIADAGRRRVWTDGHDVRSRASEFLRTIGLGPSVQVA